MFENAKWIWPTDQFEKSQRAEFLFSANVASLAAMFRAVYFGLPLTERIVTVSGEAVKNPQNFSVRVGTSFAELIEAAGGVTEDVDRIICGGPMMGSAQSDIDVPVAKATNSILCLPEAKGIYVDNPVCLRCGKCLSACPMRLQPLYLYRYAAAGDINELERLRQMDCIECGSCAYVCPGRKAGGVLLVGGTSTEHGASGCQTAQK